VLTGVTLLMVIPNLLSIKHSEIHNIKHMGSIVCGLILLQKYFKFQNLK
jgi:hypothetical protein